jgi:orotidine-5'-phosphate decarboxylase
VTTSPDPAVSARLALALDVPDAATAVALADRLAPWFGTVKVGLELFVAEGPALVRTLTDGGHDVFLDLKLLDIPATVRGAARSAAALGARWLTVHTSGGEAVLGAALDGVADAGRSEALGILGVTVLTSEPNAGAFDGRLAAAVAAGCAGVVCAAPEAARARAGAPGLAVVVPGIRLPGGDAHDQARVATPGAAVAAGATLLVIGRAVTAAPDPEGAAQAVHADVAAALVAH